MAAEISCSGEGKPRAVMNLLSRAVCEWFLILLLMVDATFSYLLTKFAQYCELKTPCPLCSRLDDFTGNQKQKVQCFWTLLCSDHKEELSSLGACPIHGKLADVHGMCEECLMPIAMQNNSNSESCRLVVGKLWVDVDRSVLHNLVLNKNIKSGSSGQRMCSCCNKTWKAKSNAERFQQLSPVGFGASRANIKPPIPRVPSRSRFSRRDSLKRIRDKVTGSSHSCGSTGADSLSHIGYTELKINSDSDSEFPASDDDDGSSRSHRKNDEGFEDFVLLSQEILPKTPDVALEEERLEDSEKEASLIDQPALLDLSEQKNVDPSSSDALTENGLGELDWAESYTNPNPSLKEESISSEDGRRPHDGEVQYSALAHSSNSSASLSMSPIAVQSDLPRNSVEITQSNDKENISIDKHAAAATEGHSIDIHPSTSHYINLNAAPAVNSEGQEGSGMPAILDVVGVDDSTIIGGNRNFRHQASTCKMGTSSKNSSPRAHDQHIEFPNIAVTSCYGPLALPDSTSVEKNDPSHVFLDGITVSEIEGESIIDRLKRQIEYDQSCINTLYKELEEERNAASDAANQAMAMITRLQEEKAALRMEASQYLRMMEEQAEYDMEALEKANDLLAEREKEVQDLETELEFLKINVLPESIVQDLPDKTYNLENESLIVEKHAVADDEHSSGDSTLTGISKENEFKQVNNSSLFNFDDEKLAMSLYLNKLEKKLRQVSDGGASHDMSNGLCLESHSDEVERIHCESKKGEENSSTLHKDVSTSNGSPAKDKLEHSVENNHLFPEKRDALHSDSCLSTMHNGETNSASLWKAIAYLHERLEALAADCDFLRHAFNALKNGEDGLQFIQEIAHQLQDLRKFESKQRCLSVP